MAHRSGEERQQVALFPVMLDDLVAQEGLPRVVDAWVEALDVAKLGFKKAVAQPLGAPPYHPGDLLRLYVWGYLNGVRSSRKLEAECKRNVECMWLLHRLAPDHKTISEFRRQNPQALVNACAGFVQFAREQGVIGGVTVAIDGTKLRAVSSIGRVGGNKRLQQMAQRNAQEIEAYLRLLDHNDEQEQSGQRVNAAAARKALDKLREQGAQLERAKQVLDEDSSRSTAVVGEPQARAMKSLHGAPGYNLQAAVDTESHLVVHHHVCTDANDRNQLQPAAEGAARALGQPCTGVADAGYANGAQIEELQRQGFIPVVAPHRGSNPTGLLDRSAFIYDATHDHFTCPQGKPLRFRKTNHDGMHVYAAKPAHCGACPIKGTCTNGKQRHLLRHPNEQALNDSAARWESQQDRWPQLRGSTVEHPFGTMKTQILINGRFLLRGLAGASTESSLVVLAYNIKRLFNLRGATWMQQALQG